MTTEKIKIEGLSDCLIALRELPDATAKNVLKRIATARLQPIAESARGAVHVRSGRLKLSVTVGTKLSKRQRRGNVKEGEDDIEVYVGMGPLPQAHMEEFGSVNNRPNPALRPAWDMHRRSLTDNLAADLWKEIQKAAARRAKKLAKASR